MNSKMIGCRVPDTLDLTIRRKAKRQGKSLNQFLVDTLEEAMQGDPEFERDKFKGDSGDIVKRIREIRERINELKESEPEGTDIDEFFFGNESDEKKEIDDAIELLELEMKQLKEELTSKKDKIKDHLASHRKVSLDHQEK